MIAEYRPQTNTYYYYMSDQINTTRIITDGNGNVVYSALHGPYGDVQKVWTSTYDPKLKFSGKEREGYSELDYFGARYYDHNSYRFISVDPIINRAEALSNPQLWNLYAYCSNNPITFLDRDGRESIFNWVWRNKWNLLEFGAGVALQFVGGASDVGTGVVISGGGTAALAPATISASAAAKTLGTALIVDAVIKMSKVKNGSNGSDDTNVKGGGKTGRKINPKRVQNFKDKIKEAREELKAAKTKEMKEFFKRKIKFYQRKLRKSEVHTRRGQGYK